MSSNTVESFKLVQANFCGLCGFFAILWGCNFVDALIFGYSKKTSLTL